MRPTGMGPAGLLLMPLLLALGLHAGAQERALRPMHIHKVRALGLEIWTEYEPEWRTELVQQGNKALFIVQSPPRVYPPAAMSYVSFPGMRVRDDEMEAVATSALRRAAQNYQVPAQERERITPTPARHGALSGYEATFSGTAHGEAVDVKVFVGHVPGRGPVAMQVYTLRGKLPHLSEQIRRAWGHVRYLEPAD